MLGAIALAAFLGAFFVVPLYAALTLCTMPCCHHESGSGAAPGLSADMSGCQTDCSIGSADAATMAAPAVVPGNDAARNAVAVTVAGAVVEPARATAAFPQTSGSARGSAAPLHVLNSTFRI